jgi:hypothetical protein
MKEVYDGEFKITKKQFDFFMEVSGEFVNENIKDIVSRSFSSTELQEKHFRFLCDRILSSDDPELKVNFSRSLMFKGFTELNHLVLGAADAFTDMLNSGGCNE